MSTPSRLTSALAVLALAAPVFAQSKDIVNQIERLDQQVNALCTTNPALAAQLKLRAEALRASLIAPQLTHTAAAGSGGYSAVAPPYAISGPCGAFDSGTPGNTVSVASTATPIPLPDLSTTTDSVVIGGLGTQTFDVDLTLDLNLGLLHHHRRRCRPSALQHRG